MTPGRASFAYTVPMLLRARRFAPLAPAFVVFVAACGQDPLPAAPVDADAGTADAAGPACGDGRVDPGETCDDGADNGTRGHCKVDCTGLPTRVSLEGDALELLTEVVGPRIVGARISVLEDPSKTATTGADAHFRIDDLEEGTEVTLVMDHPDYYPLQSATFRPPSGGMKAVTLQAITKSRFAALRAGFPPLEEESHCILASTITRLGGTLYARLRQGEVGASVVATPAPPSDSGPIYFNESVIPDPTKTATTKDGGVLYFHVPPGTYELTAQKPGVAFSKVTMKCRPGFVVNAAPSVGIQANVADPDWSRSIDPAAPGAAAAVAATDALCDRTAACVEALGAGRYPAATLASCKVVFGRALAFLDDRCPGAVGVRDAVRTFAACRAASCELALGDDVSCPNEEQAMLDAMAAYAPCYSALPR